MEQKITLNTTGGKREVLPQNIADENDLLAVDHIMWRLHFVSKCFEGISLKTGNRYKLLPAMATKEGEYLYSIFISPCIPPDLWIDVHDLPDIIIKTAHQGFFTWKEALATIAQTDERVLHISISQ